MKRSALTSFGMSISLAATLVDCGGSQMLGQQQVLPSESQAAVLDGRRGPSRLPEGGGDLLYVSSYTSSAVKSYTWPKLTHIGTLRHFTEQDGLCADAKGDIFVVNTNANNIVEYAHGGTKPIATLADLPKYYPAFCAVDRTTGDLAVTNFPYGPYGSVTGNLVIYHHARGTPKAYTFSGIYYYYMCAYDDHGNLVVDGSSSNAVVTLATMPHGESALRLLTLNQDLAFPGGVQWDGKYWAIGDQRGNVYRFDIKGTTGTKVGTTVLNGANGVYDFYIAKGQIIAPEYGANQAQVFAYPGGGVATMTITKLHQPVGAVISFGK
jgi:hypothetical protein